jgi:dihydroxyacetone kinase-like protein
MELFILYNRLDEILKDRNIAIYKPLIGNYVTTQEMAGFSLSMTPADNEIKRLWSLPAHTPFFKMMGTPQ